jgi:hypothetical protein
VKVGLSNDLGNLLSNFSVFKKAADAGRQEGQPPACQAGRTDESEGDEIEMCLPKAAGTSSRR